MSLNHPGLPGSQVSNDGDIMRMIQDIQRDLRELRAANPFAPMGMKPIPNGVELDGTLNVNGPMAVTGTLSLPAGIINNDALADPITAGSASVQQNGFGITTSDQDFASATIPVPAGFSTALVFLVASAGMINSTATADYLRATAVIQGVASREMFGYAGASGGSTSLTTAKSSLLTGLSGGVITLSTRLHSQGAAWAANASNRAYVEATATFLR